VACVKVDPSPVKKGLLPSAEVFGTAIRLAEVPNEAGHIARRNILATRQSDSEVLEVAADPRVGFCRRPEFRSAAPWLAGDA
jgi:hypothetical protein